MKKILKTINCAEKHLVKFEELLSAITLIVVVFLAAYFAIGRKFFASPPTGLDEIARYLVPIIVMLGSSVAINRNSHVTAGSIDLFTKNEKIIYYVTIFIDFLLVFICTTLAYVSWVRYGAVLKGSQSSTLLNIPMKILELPIPIGLTLWMIQYFMQLFRDITRYNKD